MLDSQSYTHIHMYKHPRFYTTRANLNFTLKTGILRIGRSLRTVAGGTRVAGGEVQGGKTLDQYRPDFQTAFTLTKVARTLLERTTGDLYRVVVTGGGEFCCVNVG